MIAYPLGLFDCCGVSDGSAAAIVTTPEIARSIKKIRISATIKAIQVAAVPARKRALISWDGSTLRRPALRRPWPTMRPGLKIPAQEISMMEVHDCFSITEFVTMEGLTSPQRRSV